MKTKLLLIAFMMLTVFIGWSQDTISKAEKDTRPITFPFWMVREIAMDLEEKQRLELEATLFALEIETYQKLLESMEQKEQQHKLKLDLLNKNISLLENQLHAEKQIKKSSGKLVWCIKLLGALGAGFIIGKF